MPPGIAGKCGPVATARHLDLGAGHGAATLGNIAARRRVAIIDFDQLYARTREDFDEDLMRAWREAAARDREALEGWLQSVSFEDCHLFDIYEALATAQPPERELLRREFDRLLACAAVLPEEKQILSEMSAFSFLGDSDEDRAWFVARLAPLLAEDEPRRRRHAASLLGHFVGGAHTEVLRQLSTMVTRDPDFATRLEAWWTLGDVHINEPEFPAPRLRGWDRVRVALGLAPRR